MTLARATQSRKLRSAGSAAVTLNARQENAEVKASGALSRDIRAGRAADRRAVLTNRAVRAAALRAVSTRVERRAVDSKAAVKAEGVRAVARQAETASSRAAMNILES